MSYKPTEEWISSCATWPAGDDEYLQGVQAMARELLELRRDCEHFHNAYHHALERLAAAEMVVEEAKRFYLTYHTKAGTPYALQIAELSLETKFDAYDKLVKEEAK